MKKSGSVFVSIFLAFLFFSLACNFVTGQAPADAASAPGAAESVLPKPGSWQGENIILEVAEDGTISTLNFTAHYISNGSISAEYLADANIQVGADGTFEAKGAKYSYKGKFVSPTKLTFDYEIYKGLQGQAVTGGETFTALWQDPASAAAPAPTAAPLATPTQAPTPTLVSNSSYMGVMCADNTLIVLVTDPKECATHGGFKCYFYTDGSCESTPPDQPRENPSGVNPPPAADGIYLSELKPKKVSLGYGTYSVGTFKFSSGDAGDNLHYGDPILLAGVKYPHGIFAHAPSHLIFDIGGKYTELTATIGLIERINCGDGADFIIRLDGTEIYRSPTLSATSKPVNIQVSVAGGKELSLMADEKDSWECDWAIWGDPYLR